MPLSTFVDGHPLLELVLRVRRNPVTGYGAALAAIAAATLVRNGRQAVLATVIDISERKRAGSPADGCGTGSQRASRGRQRGSGRDRAEPDRALAPQR
jgi:hypothetical protein